MPQIWLTYDEMADHFGCSATEARSGAISQGWRRRRCGDGATRVKLLPDMALDYMRAQVVKHSAGMVRDLQARASSFERGPAAAPLALPAATAEAALPPPQSKVA
ncbi:hypothetical protein [Methylobacterium oryzihabitans]|uniref:Uncharacterized protein n=1 Tax=Methylobacterium oryzihabitans TaxID=2499852 RepID=A0A437P969_9HYPH|nr:hypothetical protein [Methylobacterium oryzihabitans]RVU18795.1 hypothetical protein EOE48_10455 [Methylobacterium oryzihabitans]